MITYPDDLFMGRYLLEKLLVEVVCVEVQWVVDHADRHSVVQALLADDQSQGVLWHLHSTGKDQSLSRLVVLGARVF